MDASRSRSKRPKKKRSYRTARDIERANKAAFHEAAWAQRCCQKCGEMKEYQSHHVVEKAELRRRQRLDLVWDTRNVMRLCEPCHRRHTNRMEPLPLRLLQPQHFEFAFYVMGAAAHSYLGRMYVGQDDRLDEYLARWEEEHAERS